MAKINASASPMRRFAEDVEAVEPLMSTRRLPILAMAAFVSANKYTEHGLPAERDLAALAAYAPHFARPFIITSNRARFVRKRMTTSAQRAGMPIAMHLYCTGWIYPSIGPRAENPISNYRSIPCVLRALQWSGHGFRADGASIGDDYEARRSRPSDAESMPRGLLYFHADLWLDPQRLPTEYSRPWLVDGAVKQPIGPRSWSMKVSKRMSTCRASELLVAGRHDLPLCVDDEATAAREWRAKGCWWWDRVEDVVAATANYCANVSGAVCPWTNAGIDGHVRRCFGWADAFFVPREAAWLAPFEGAVATFNLHNTWHETATPTLLSLLAAALGSTLLRMPCRGDCCSQGASEREVRQSACGHKADWRASDVRRALWSVLRGPRGSEWGANRSS